MSVKQEHAEIRPLTIAQLPLYADVIRHSFITVAEDFGLTMDNCPNFKSFITDERLAEKFTGLYFPFGYYAKGELIGFASLTYLQDGVYEMNDVSVLPGLRHRGAGTRLLEFCKEKVKEFGGNKITIGIIEDHTVLKDWYAANGFVHTGVKRFDHLPFTVGFMEWELDT